MFYGHAMLIGGKPERIEIFIVSGLSLSRPVDTKADLKLNNIIATPSSNLILTQSPQPLYPFASTHFQLKLLVTICVTSESVSL